jgi:hypothetical protein
VDNRNGADLRLSILLPIFGAFCLGAVSLQAQNWSTATPPSGLSVNMSGVGYNGSKFIAAGTDLRYISSTDGINWTDEGAIASVPINTNSIFQVAWIPFLSLWVASSNVGLFTDAKIYTSTNGTTWTPRNTGLTNGTANRFGSSGSLVISGSGGSLIVKSTNGTSWTIQDLTSVLGTNVSVQGVLFANSQWMIVGGSGKVATSPDGNTWTLQSTPVSSTLRSVVYGNGRYVAIGPSNTAIWSTNGTTWNSATIGVAQTFTGITFVNGNFVAVGANGAIASSTNGATWNVNTSNATLNLNNVIANGNTGTSTVVVGGVSPTPILRYLTASALPLELSSFSAKAIESEKAIELNWTTENERDFAHFEVERSTDGKQYETIGKVMGEGTTFGTQTYEFTDTKPQNGINYYRLRLVDLDGTDGFSPMRSVNISLDDHLSIAPNPTTDNREVVLYYESGHENEVRIRVFNTLGVLAFEQQATFVKGDNYVAIDLSDLTSGSYFIRLEDGSQAPMVQQIIVK